MPMFVLCHTHRPEECAISIAAWKAFPSRLRRGRPLGSCATGGHKIGWMVEADSHHAALALLPPYVAERTVAEAARAVPLP